MLVGQIGENMKTRIVWRGNGESKTKQEKDQQWEGCGSLYLFGSAITLLCTCSATSCSNNLVFTGSAFVVVWSLEPEANVAAIARSVLFFRDWKTCKNKMVSMSTCTSFNNIKKKYCFFSNQIETSKKWTNSRLHVWCVQPPLQLLIYKYVVVCYVYQVLKK